MSLRLGVIALTLLAACCETLAGGDGGLRAGEGARSAAADGRSPSVAPPAARRRAFVPEAGRPERLERIRQSLQRLGVVGAAAEPAGACVTAPRLGRSPAAVDVGGLPAPGYSAAAPPARVATLHSTRSSRFRSPPTPRACRSSRHPPHSRGALGDRPAGDAGRRGRAAHREPEEHLRPRRRGHEPCEHDDGAQGNDALRHVRVHPAGRRPQHQVRAPPAPRPVRCRAIITRRRHAFVCPGRCLTGRTAATATSWA